MLVKVGDAIAQGDVILILEAMKMETEIRSPSQGIVQSVSFQAGDAVKVGDDLITLS